MSKLFSGTEGALEINTADIADDAVTAAKISDAVTLGGGMESMQVFTSSGTWTKPSGITKVKVTVVGGGGGGGGEVNNVSAGGGAGGGTAVKFIDVSSISSETVTIGAGGADSTTADGAAGGTSSFGSHCSATGGGGGQATENPDVSAVGGAGSGGDFNIQGEGGHYSSWNSGAHFLGMGGASTHGFGGVGSYQTAAWDGKGYGGGGSGRHQSNAAGGNGTDGIVIVEEFK